MEAFQGKWKSDFSDVNGFEEWMNVYGVDEGGKNILRGKSWIWSYDIDGDTYSIAFYPEDIPEKKWPKMKFGETYDSFDMFGQPVKMCMKYSEGVITEETETPDGKAILAERKVLNSKLYTKMTCSDKSGKSAVLSVRMKKI